jgi:Domain of unknown function (DUF4173)
MFKQLDFRILAYSIFASLLLVSDNYFNYIGWFVFGVAQTCIILYFKNKRTGLDWFFAAVALLSALNFVFYTNFLSLLFSAIIFLYSSGWLISKLPSDRFMQIVHLIAPYLSSYTNVMQFKYKNDLPSGLPNDKLATKSKISETVHVNPIKSINWGQITFSIVVTVVVLSVILPLLSFANPQFGVYIKNLFELQWIRETFDWLFENIFSFTMILRVLVFVFVYNLLPRLISFCKHQKDVELEEKKDSELSIPKIVTVFTLFAFLVVQVQTTLNPSLLTKAAGDVANETFFHLSIVCFVAFGLIYLNYKDKLVTKVWSLILLAQTLLLGMIAFNSDWSYVINWGLTHKRLYGFSVLGIVLGIIAVFGYFAYHNSRRLVQGFAVIFCLVSVITNMINMDKLIYENPPKEATGIEQNYVNGLGLDTANLKSRYLNAAQKYKQISKTGDLESNCSETNWLRNYNEKIQYLKNKYSDFRLLDWNYSEFVNYLEVKDVNLGTIENPNIPVDSRPIDSVSPNCYTRGGQSQNVFD